MATSLFRKNFPGVEKLQKEVDRADFIIGLDLHKKTTAICVIDPSIPDEPVLERKRLQNAQLLATIQSFPGKKIITAEAAYGWFSLRAALDSVKDTTLILLDARKTSSWIRTSGMKNDRVDAQILCHVCLHGGICSLAVHQPANHSMECCRLVKHRDNLVKQRTRIKNQLRVMERDYGPNPFTGECSQRSETSTFLESTLLDELSILHIRIKEAEKHIATLSTSDTTVSLLQSIPGIGPITAFALRHKIEALDRFNNPAHLSSYFGLSVRERQSGNTLVKGKITKTGSTLIRKLLVQGAQVIRYRCPHTLSLYFPILGQEVLLQDRKHSNKVVTALARKNLTFVYHVWKNNTPFDLNAYRERRQQNIKDG